VLVVDASALSVALADDTSIGDSARGRLRGQALRAPALIDVEVLSVLRGRVLGSKLTANRARTAVHDLRAMRFPRAPHQTFAERIWELRDNVSTYDAAYVALAELLEAPLLTADRKLSRASGPRCHFELLES